MGRAVALKDRPAAQANGSKLPRHNAGAALDVYVNLPLA